MMKMKQTNSAWVKEKKIRLATSAHSGVAQRILFRMGCHWIGHKPLEDMHPDYRNLDSPYIIITPSGTMMDLQSKTGFDHVGYEEITLSDLQSKYYKGIGHGFTAKQNPPAIDKRVII